MSMLGLDDLWSSVKSIRMDEYSSLYLIYRLRQLLYLWSNVYIVP